jgi:hypothetical protein
LTWVTRYQPEPDFEVGQDVVHADPVSVPPIVTRLLMPSLTLIVARVEADVRRLMPSQAGARTTAPGVADGVGSGPE